MLGALWGRRGVALDRKVAPIHEARSLRFYDWAAGGGFVADREPVDFTVWRYLRPVYESVPWGPKHLDLTIMKPAQAGASIFAMLASIWLSLKGRYQGAYFLPTHDHAMLFSKDRWIRLARENKPIHDLMGDPDTPHLRRIIDEGSASTRKVAWSIVYFSYMGGKITTESLPLDWLIFDEVQEMLLAEMETTEQRLAASHLGAILRVSTANFEDADIHHFYRESDMREFFTRCGCADGVNLAECWSPTEGPLCIDRGNGSTPSVPREPFYVCPRCATILTDVQDGRFVATAAEPTRRIGFHWAQMLSPRQTAARILETWDRRIDTKNFYNRVLGRPFTDPKTQPVSEADLIAAQRPDLRWGPPERDVHLDGSVMGIDQMGHDNRVVIKARVDGQMRLVWLEMIQGDDPWRRCAELMRLFKVRVCCVEALPNFNEAHRFAKAFDSRVWLVYYKDLPQELVQWGDRMGGRDQITVRKTDEEARARWSANVDQYRMMSWSLQQWSQGHIVTPDARTLTQEIVDQKGRRTIEICREMFWLHLRRVALVTDVPVGRELERVLRRRVVKVGIDPHFAYSNMLCDVAWVRHWGTGMLGVHTGETAVERNMGQPKSTAYTDQIRERLGIDTFNPPRTKEDEEDLRELVCGTCENYTAPPPGSPPKMPGRCEARHFMVTPDLVKCHMYIPMEDGDDEP